MAAVNQSKFESKSENGVGEDELTRLPRHIGLWTTRVAFKLSEGPPVRRE
jgi:hypothetical protein